MSIANLCPWRSLEKTCYVRCRSMSGLCGPKFGYENDCCLSRRCCAHTRAGRSGSSGIAAQAIIASSSTSTSSSSSSSIDSSTLLEQPEQQQQSAVYFQIKASTLNWPRCETSLVDQACEIILLARCDKPFAFSNKKEHGRPISRRLTSTRFFIPAYIHLILHPV